MKLIEIERAKLKPYELINENCKEFLNTGQVLFKGINAHFNFKKKESRSGRSKTYSNYETTEMLHHFMQNSGFEATRLNSIFATPDLYHAKNFGTPFLVYPLDGYSATWVDPKKSQRIYSNLVNKYKKDFGMRYKELDNFTDLGGRRWINIAEDIYYFMYKEEEPELDEVVRVFWEVFETAFVKNNLEELPNAEVMIYGACYFLNYDNAVNKGYFKMINM